MGLGTGTQADIVSGYLKAVALSTAASVVTLALVMLYFG